MHVHGSKMAAGPGTTTVFLRDPNHSKSYVNFIRQIGEAKTKHVRCTHTVGPWAIGGRLKRGGSATDQS